MAAEAPMFGMHESAALGFTRATISDYDKGRPDWTQSQVEVVLENMSATWKNDEHGAYPGE
jgi:hypothetical protein